MTLLRRSLSYEKIVYVFETTLSYFKIYFIWHLLFFGLAAKCNQ